MAVGSGAAQRLQRPTRPMPEGKTAWRRRERDVVTRRSDACARERRARRVTTGHISTRLRTSQAECSQSGARRTGRTPAAAVRAGPGWGAPETRVWRAATGAAVFIERVRPPADATHRSFYPFVNNPLLAHPAGSNWPAPAGAPWGARRPGRGRRRARTPCFWFDLSEKYPPSHCKTVSSRPWPWRCG